MNDYAIIYTENGRKKIDYLQAESFDDARSKFYDKRTGAFAMATYENPDNKRMKEILKGLKGK